jgi:hypothetical protein
VLRASFWLAPWLSTTSCDDPEDKTRDASDRLLPPVRFACTRTSCVPGSLRDFHRVEASRSLGLRAVDRGTECFTTLANASADRSWTRFANGLEPLASPLGRVRDVSSVGVFFPRRLLSIEPLTSLSPLPLSPDDGAPSRVLPLRALASSSLSCVRKPPRSPFPPARERRWFDTTRDAFHRQGPFTGFGGLYSPDPATAACEPPFGVMRRPLNDVLTSSWV